MNIGVVCYPTFGGSGVPAGSGFVQIYSNSSAFAAVKADGRLKNIFAGKLRRHVKRNDKIGFRVIGNIVVWIISIIIRGMCGLQISIPTSGISVRILF